MRRACLLCALAVLACSGAAHAASSASPKQLSLYSVLTKKAYVNNADDRARGEGHNPFGNYSGAAVTPPTKELQYGPFAGDEGEYEFALYTDKSHHTSAGSAIFVCQYDFDAQAFCDASFSLANGTLIAKGSYPFDAESFQLAILAGASGYRGSAGYASVQGLGIATQPKPARRAVPMLQSQHLILHLQPAASGGAHTFTVYSHPSQETFVDNNDDEARGDINNPFGAKETAAAEATEKGNGPFPGDEALFGFDTYTSAGLDHSAGSATFTCQYYFYKNAFCDATFQTTSGTLFGSGAVNFSGTSFTLPITGGTGTYDGVSGDLESTTHGPHLQRLTFRIN